jgi:hypothetical protein
MEKEISFTRGDTYVIGFTTTGLEGQLDTAYFTCRKDKLRETPVLFQASLGNGISYLGDNEYQVVISSNLTKDIPVGTYYYDLELSKNNSVKTALKGKLKLTWDVTGDNNE